MSPFMGSWAPGVGERRGYTSHLISDDIVSDLNQFRTSTSLNYTSLASVAFFSKIKTVNLITQTTS